jgi:hypothetical protein
MKLLLGRLHLLGALVLAFAFFGAGSAQALPALQLGPSGSGWTYDAVTQTWVNDGSSFQLAAYANATMGDGGSGGYAWETTTEARIAYLVVSAVPKQTDPTGGSGFDITILNDGVVDITAGICSPVVTSDCFVTAGYGAAPMSDPNSLAPHSIFDTYYEVYAFTFDGPLDTICDTQPGQTGCGEGYFEYLDIQVGALPDGVEGLHFDLYTLNSLDQVEGFAPFSHDAETGLVPEPSAALLFGVGGLIAGTTLRRRR